MKEEQVLNDSTYRSILRNAITAGNYQILDNIFQYTIDIKNDVISHIQNMCDRETSIVRLKALQGSIKQLIDGHGLDYLQENCHNIEIEIETIIQEKENSNQTRNNIERKNRIRGYN